MQGRRFFVISLLAVVAWPGATGRRCYADLYAEAAAAYQAGDWPLAATRFRDFAASQPTDPRSCQAIFFAAEAMSAQGDYARAVTEFETYLEVAPADSPKIAHALYRLGHAAFETGDFKLASEAYGRAIRDFPEGPLIAHCRRGLLLATAQLAMADYHAGQFQASADRVTAALESIALESNQTDVLISLQGLRGHCYHALGAFQPALADFDVVLAAIDTNHPQFLPFLRAAVESHISLGQWESALGHLNMELDLEPDVTAELTRLEGIALANLGRWDEVRDLAARLEAMPHVVRMIDREMIDRWRWDIAELAWQAGEVGLAENCWRSLIDHNEISELALAAAKRLKALEAAAASPVAPADLPPSRVACERLHAEQAHDLAWHRATLQLAKLATAEQRTIDAISYCQDSLDNHPPHDLVPHALYLLGTLHATQSNWDAVISAMQRVATEFPEHHFAPRALYWIAEASFRKHDYEAARQHLERLLAYGGDDFTDCHSMVQLRMAQIDAHLGRWQAALRQAQSVLEAYPQFGQRFEVDYLIGRCHASLGEFTQAREAYHRVLSSPQADHTETAAMTQWMIGETYLHQREYQQAVIAFLRVESSHDWPEWQASGLRQAAKAYLALERPRPAMESLTRLLAKYPHTEHAEAAAAALEAIKIALDQPQLAREPLGEVSH